MMSGAVGDLEIVATAGVRERVLELATQLQPAIAVVHGHMARMAGLAITQSPGRQVPARRGVVVRVYAMLGEMALAGEACRFLLKDGSREELVAATGPQVGDADAVHWF